jgi:hypothetical protein
MQLNLCRTWCTHTRNILHVLLSAAGGLGTLAEVSEKLSKLVKPATGPRRGGEFAAGGFQLDKLLLLEFGLDYPLQGWDSDHSKCCCNNTHVGELYQSGHLHSAGIIGSLPSSSRSSSTYRVCGRPSNACAMQLFCHMLPSQITTKHW